MLLFLPLPGYTGDLSPKPDCTSVNVLVIFQVSPGPVHPTAPVRNRKMTTLGVLQQHCLGSSSMPSKARITTPGPAFGLPQVITAALIDYCMMGLVFARWVLVRTMAAACA